MTKRVDFWVALGRTYFTHKGPGLSHFQNIQDFLADLYRSGKPLSNVVMESMGFRAEDITWPIKSSSFVSFETYKIAKGIVQIRYDFQHYGNGTVSGEIGDLIRVNDLYGISPRKVEHRRAMILLFPWTFEELDALGGNWLGLLDEQTRID